MNIICHELKYLIKALKPCEEEAIDYNTCLDKKKMPLVNANE